MNHVICAEFMRGLEEEEKQMTWMGEKWQMRRGLGTGGRGLGGDGEVMRQRWGRDEEEMGRLARKVKKPIVKCTSAAPPRKRRLIKVAKIHENDALVETRAPL